jgi:hypothetical protein
MNYILGSDSITVFVDGKSYTINKQAHTFNLVLKAVKENDLVALRNAVNIRQGIVDGLSKTSSKVRIEGSNIFYNDREVTGLVASRIFEVIRLGLDVTPMVKFLENLMANPSKRAVDELFGFMEACNLPITSDGHFLAYKRVREDYKDVHSGSLDNSVGKVLSMERNLVDEDKNNTCSYGLHFCSYDYLRHFGGSRIVVLKINPADVVAIPADYNNSKGRTCKYEVVDELPVNEYNLPSEEIPADYSDDYGYDEPDFEDVFVDNSIAVKDDFGSTTIIMPKAVTLTLPTPPVPKTPKVRAKTDFLSKTEVKRIRKFLANGNPVAFVARKFNISARTVARIRDKVSPYNW